MGHTDYAVLHRYVRLSSERDLGPPSEWANFIVVDVVGATAVLANGAWRHS